MPVTTRQQLKKQEIFTTSQFGKKCTNNANIDFEDASREWRKNKIKHENCCFTYTCNQKQS